MAPKAPGGVAGEPVRNRCRCGHFPTSHMRVAPMGSSGGGSYRLDPDGPCAICGETACHGFSPAL